MATRVTRHRVGRPYRRARQQMFALYGTVCHLCGHDGAGEADHLEAVALDPGQPLDPHTMRPAHGTSSPCPTCGRCCNQAKGTKTTLPIVRTTRAW